MDGAYAYPTPGRVPTDSITEAEQPGAAPAHGGSMELGSDSRPGTGGKATSSSSTFRQPGAVLDSAPSVARTMSTDEPQAVGSLITGRSSRPLQVMSSENGSASTATTPHQGLKRNPSQLGPPKPPNGHVPAPWAQGRPGGESQASPGANKDSGMVTVGSSQIQPSLSSPQGIVQRGGSTPNIAAPNTQRSLTNQKLEVGGGGGAGGGGGGVHGNSPGMPPMPIVEVVSPLLALKGGNNSRLGMARGMSSGSLNGRHEVGAGGGGDAGNNAGDLPPQPYPNNAQPGMYGSQGVGGAGWGAAQRAMSPGRAAEFYGNNRVSPGPSPQVPDSKEIPNDYFTMERVTDGSMPNSASGQAAEGTARTSGAVAAPTPTRAFETEPASPGPGNGNPHAKIYEVWKGNEVFYCGGRIIMGPSRRNVIFSLVLVGGPGAVFSAVVAPTLDYRFNISWIVITAAWVAAVLGALVRTGTMDPGLLPRNPNPPSQYLTGQLPRTQQVDYRGYQVAVRYNETTHFYQPPRAHHCSINDNCYDKFDHHCPWIGTTIARRNYRMFLIFVFGTTLLTLWCMAGCILAIVQDARHALKGVVGSQAREKALGDSLGKQWLAFVIGAYCLIAFVFVGILSGLHAYLISHNMTTYESFRVRRTGAPNPYNRGCLWNWWAVCCLPTRPSHVDFRAPVSSLRYYKWWQPGDSWEDVPQSPAEQTPPTQQQAPKANSQGSEDV